MRFKQIIILLLEFDSKISHRNIYPILGNNEKLFNSMDYLIEPEEIKDKETKVCCCYFRHLELKSQFVTGATLCSIACDRKKKNFHQSG